MKTIQLLTISIVLAVIAGGCRGEGPTAPTGPTGIDGRDAPAAPGNAERPAVPAEYEKTITITAVRVTNTSGGTDLVALNPPGLPIHVHVDVDYNRTDLAALKEAGAFLEVSLLFDGPDVVPSAGLILGEFTAEQLEKNEPATVLFASATPGQWRNARLRIHEAFVAVPYYEDDGRRNGRSSLRDWTVVTPPDEYRIGPVDVVATVEKQVYLNVRVTNTSGGTDLVAAPPPGSPIHVHPNVNYNATDLAALKEAGAVLVLSMSFDDAPVIVETVQWTAEQLEKNEPATAMISTLHRGIWRNATLSIYEAFVGVPVLGGWRRLDDWAVVAGGLYGKRFDVADPATLDRPPVHPRYEKTITITAVRVTNTSGGTVLVAAEPPGKPVIVHVDVIDDNFWGLGSDIEAFKEAGGSLALTLSFGDAPVSVSETVYFTADMLEVNEPAAAWLTADVVNGQWVETTLSYTAELTIEGWTLKDLPAAAARAYAVDVAIPYPSDVVFHPVVTDSAQIPAETEKLESLFLGGDGFGILNEWDRPWVAHSPLYDYTPFVIGEHRIGPAVVVDTPDISAIGTVYFEGPSRAALRVMAESYRTGEFDWDGSSKDFFVAVPTADVFEMFYIGGVAWLNTPFSAVNIDKWDAINSHYENVVWALIHEMGHNLGLLHVHDDVDSPGGRDLNYPAYPDQNINEDAYRVDADGHVVTLHREDYADFMGISGYYYSGTETRGDWVSAYHYRMVAESALGIEPTLEARRPVVMQ